MTVTRDEFDSLRGIVEQIAITQAQGAQQHNQEMAELRQLQASNARAIEANSTGLAENRTAIQQLTTQVSELSSGVDAALRTVDSMGQVMESLETIQNEMRQSHREQMDRLGNVLDILVQRYPEPPQS